MACVSRSQWTQLYKDLQRAALEVNNLIHVYTKNFLFSFHNIIIVTLLGAEFETISKKIVTQPTKPCSTICIRQV